jgi:phospholipase C
MAVFALAFLASVVVSQAGTGAKINHFVVLMMENRPPDHTFGCMNLPGFSSTPDGTPIYHDPLDPSQGNVTFTCGSAPYACPSGPSYDMFAGKTQPSVGNPAEYPYSQQSDQWAYKRGAKDQAIKAFGPQGNEVPIKKAFAEHFAVFNKYFSSVPSYSTPNHLFSQAATSCGIDDNIRYNDCGGKKASFPMKTIYDNLAESNISFSMYSNSTPHSADTNMDGVARYRTRFFGYPEFFDAAAKGTLPAFSWIVPGHDPRNGKPNDDHPCHDVALGERLQKDIYESLRSGPGWANTMFLITYDDAGGFYDHVVPPYEDVPDDEAPCKVKSGCNHKFDFKRLGPRVTSIIASPWIPKGTVIQEPKGPYASSQWEHSSISATIKNLFNLPNFLTKRDAWAGSFSELLTLKSPRTDAPLHFPDAPPPSTSGPNLHGCGGEDEITRRQERHIELWSRYNGIEQPSGWKSWAYKEAQEWIEKQYHIWRHGLHQYEI